MFEKGDIIFYNHINGNKGSRAKEGPHAWVILHSYTHPLKTYLIAPITSNPGYSNTSVTLKQANYSNILSHDSYIDLRSITVANEEYILPLKGLDKNNKNTLPLTVNPKLKPIDVACTDLAAIMALELGQTIKGLVAKEQETFRTTYSNLLKNEVTNTLEKILEQIDNVEIKENIKVLFDCLLNKISNL